MGKRIVSKSNELIQMRLLELDRPLGLAEMKVANAIYSKISHDDNELKLYTLSVQELASLAGLDRDRLYREIDRITHRLCGTVVTIMKPNNSWLKAALFSTAEYSAEKQTIDFQVAEKLRPYLLRLKEAGCGFTQYYLDQTTALQSKHALRMYELLRQFLPLKKVREDGLTSGFRRVLVKDLREYLGVQNKYSRYNNFRDKVLGLAQRELAEKTDIAFEFKPIRQGRTITTLEFLIRVNNRSKPELSAPADVLPLPTCKNETMLRMIRMSIPNIPDRNAILLANSYSQEVLTEALLGLMEAGDGVRNPVAYLNGILKNKRLEPSARTHRTTHEKLTDRSWAEGLVIEDWDS